MEQKLNYTFSGYMEAIAIISDRFNIKPETLLYDEKEIKFKTPKQKLTIANYKHQVLCQDFLLELI